MKRTIFLLAAISLVLFMSAIPIPKNTDSKASCIIIAIEGTGTGHTSLNGTYHLFPTAVGLNLKTNVNPWRITPGSVDPQSLITIQALDGNYLVATGTDKLRSLKLYEWILVKEGEENGEKQFFLIKFIGKKTVIRENCITIMPFVIKFNGSSTAQLNFSELRDQDLARIVEDLKKEPNAQTYDKVFGICPTVSII